MLSSCRCSFNTGHRGTRLVFKILKYRVHWLIPPRIIIQVENVQSGSASFLVISFRLCLKDAFLYIGIYFRVLVADAVPQVSGLSTCQIEAGVPMNLCPGRPVSLETLKNFFVVLLREWPPLATVRLFKRTLNSQLDHVLHVAAVDASLTHCGLFWGHDRARRTFRTLIAVAFFKRGVRLHQNVF